MKKSKGVFLGSREGYDYAYSQEVQEKLNRELDMLPDLYPQELFEDVNAEFPALKDVEYAFSTWGCPKLDEGRLHKIMPNLKALFYAAGSVQYFARPYLHRGVKIYSAWAANAVPVAETTVAEIILANKGFYQTMHRDGPVWTEHNFGKPFMGNYNVNVGIIGAGMIGKLVIRMLKAYQLQVKVFDPFLSHEMALELGVEKVESLPDLFASCHVISNHLANNPQTVGMIDKNCFNNMGTDSVFINTGRGATVVEADLIQAMKDDPTRVAVLDVTYPEPPQEGSELLTLHNVILTPHMAGSIGNEVQRMGDFMYSEFEALTQGKQTKYEVSEEMLKTMA